MNGQMAQPQGPSNAEQFKQSFREEAREILTELESALLALNENPKDTELVSRIFRGLHTIKGSGAMFGFEKLASFTHNLETAFDEVRTGRLQISAELIDLTLAALDQIRALLEEGAAGAAPVDRWRRPPVPPSSRASASWPGSKNATMRRRRTRRRKMRRRKLNRRALPSRLRPAPSRTGTSALSPGRT
jgi:chemotaxis protein histidine kinase CheA